MFKLETVQEQAQILQDICINAMDNFFPKKEVLFTSDDETWISSRIKSEIQERKRKFLNHRKN